MMYEVKKSELSYQDTERVFSNALAPCVPDFDRNCGRALERANELGDLYLHELKESVKEDRASLKSYMRDRGERSDNEARSERLHRLRIQAAQSEGQAIETLEALQMTELRRRRESDQWHDRARETSLQAKRDVRECASKRLERLEQGMAHQRLQTDSLVNTYLACSRAHLEWCQSHAKALQTSMDAAVCLRAKVMEYDLRLRELSQDEVDKRRNYELAYLGQKLSAFTSRQQEELTWTDLEMERQRQKREHDRLEWSTHKSMQMEQRSRDADLRLRRDDQEFSHMTFLFNSVVTAGKSFVSPGAAIS